MSLANKRKFLGHVNRVSYRHPPKPPGVPRRERPNMQCPHPLPGRLQWWKKPVTVNADAPPLQAGADFTFVDGRPTPFSSLVQQERRMHQVQLGKRIVQLLGEMKQADELYKEKLDDEQRVDADFLTSKPKAKGISFGRRKADDATE